MPQIPANNLKERLLNQGYNPKFINLRPPVLDNSAVVKPETKPKPTFVPQTATTAKPTSAGDLTAKSEPEFINIDDWSDFEED